MRFVLFSGLMRCASKARRPFVYHSKLFMCSVTDFEAPRFVPSMIINSDIGLLSMSVNLQLPIAHYMLKPLSADLFHFHVKLGFFVSICLKSLHNKPDKLQEHPNNSSILKSSLGFFFRNFLVIFTGCPKNLVHCFKGQKVLIVESCTIFLCNCSFGIAIGWCKEYF